MSSWTYINGVIGVSPMGRTPAESRYILETVLDHLPIVWGSERCMAVDIIDMGSMSNSSHSEFGERYEKPNLDGTWKDFGGFDGGHNYKLVLTAHLRDTEFKETYYGLQKWLCRLAKRIHVKNVLVKVSGWEHQEIIATSPDWNPYVDMFEHPSWSGELNDEGYPEDVNWCEYLMWDKAATNYGHTQYPDMLLFKYYNNKENDEEMLRRLKGRNK